MSAPTLDPYATPDLWRESAVQPRRPAGRREHERLRDIALRLEWVRVDPARRAFAENLVWWAEEHLDHPAQRLWLLRRWTLNRAHGLAQGARDNDDLARAFAGDLRRFRTKLKDEDWHAPEGVAERDFLLLWAELHDDRDRLPELEAALNRILDHNPSSFRQVTGQLRALLDQAEAIARHQYAPERILFRKAEQVGWFLDPNASCPKEGAWMRHCGNRGAREGDRLVSLRRREKRAGVECWCPLLTGVLDAQGMLVELKGPENTRPPAKFHWHIAWLCAHPCVRGLRLGTRALPDKDFVFWSLSWRLQKWLREHRPDLVVRCADGHTASLMELIPAPAAPPPPLTWRDRLAWVPGAAWGVGMVAGGLFGYALLVTVLEGAILILRDNLP